jgi:outer membrane protein assembly factor BamB
MALLVVLAAAGSRPAAVAGAAPPAEWPAYGQGPEHAGNTPDRLGSVLLQRWSAAFGVSVQGAPVVAGGTVFFGADDRVLRALAVDDGQVRWTFTATGLLRSAPVVADGQVWVTDFDGRTYALRAADGLLLWDVALGGRTGASPVIADGNLYVATALGTVYAIEPETGAVRWKVEVGLPIWSSPAAGGGRVYVEDYAGGVHALESSDGHQAWAYQTDGELRMSPALCGGKLIVASSSYDRGGLVALDARAGTVLWTRSISGNNLWSAPTIAPLPDGRVFVLAGNLGWLYAFNLETGGLVWNTHMIPQKFGGRAKYPTMMTPVAGGDHVYVGAYYAVDLPSAIYSFNLEDGRLLWTSPAAGKIATPPAYADGTVYFGSYDGRAYAYSPVRVFIGEQEVDFGDLSPVIQANRSLVPFRALFEAVGATVAWDQAAQRVMAKRGEHIIEMTVGQTSATVDGRSVILEVPPAVVNQRTLVPLRFVAEALGELKWDQTHLRVDITLR